MIGKGTGRRKRSLVYKITKNIQKKTIMGERQLEDYCGIVILYTYIIIAVTPLH